MLWNSFVQYLTAKGTSPRTIEAYAEDWGYFSTWLLSQGMTNYLQISERTIQQFFIHLQTKPRGGTVEYTRITTPYISKSTIQRYYRTLSAVFTWCYSQHMIRFNPIKHVPKPKVPLEPIETYTPNEFRALLNSVNTRDKALLSLYYDTGIRLTEGTQLKAADINIEARTATVLGKGNRKRTVPFGNQAKIAIVVWFLEYNGSSLAFPSRTGNALTRSGVNNLVRKACLRANVPLRKELVHSIRHTAACNLLEATNGDIMYVKEVLGHSSINTTMRYVRHLEQQRVLRKAQTLTSPLDCLVNSC